MSVESRMDDLERYYDHRAPEYEALYYRAMPERNAELKIIERELRELATGRRVLEIACGTGYWTEVMAATAGHVVATDLSEEMLRVLGKRGLPSRKVTIEKADAYALDHVRGDFSLAVANFWLSHVPKAKLDAFLDGLDRRLGSGAVVFMTDNFHVADYGGELRTYPGEADTYKHRELSDGSTWEVIKNYYSVEDLRALLGPRSSDLDIRSGEYYWWLLYRVS